MLRVRKIYNLFFLPDLIFSSSYARLVRLHACMRLLVLSHCALHADPAPTTAPSEGGHAPRVNDDDDDSDSDSLAGMPELIDDGKVNYLDYLDSRILIAGSGEQVEDDDTDLLPVRCKGCCRIGNEHSRAKSFLEQVTKDLDSMPVVIVPQDPVPGMPTRPAQNGSTANGVHHDDDSEEGATANGSTNSRLADLGRDKGAAAASKPRSEAPTSLPTPAMAASSAASSEQEKPKDGAAVSAPQGDIMAAPKGPAAAGAAAAKPSKPASSKPKAEASSSSAEPAAPSASARETIEEEDQFLLEAAHARWWDSVVGAPAPPAPSAAPAKDKKKSKEASAESSTASAPSKPKSSSSSITFTWPGPPPSAFSIEKNGDGFVVTSLGKGIRGKQMAASAAPKLKAAAAVGASWQSYETLHAVFVSAHLHVMKTPLSAEEAKEEAVSVCVCSILPSNYCQICS